MKAVKAGIEVQFEGKDAPATDTFDRVLVAIGRRANGDKLGADKAGVSVDKRGIIEVDKQMRTNVPHIFAIGDLAGGPMLAHKATHEAKVAAEVAAGYSHQPPDGRSSWAGWRVVLVRSRQRANHPAGSEFAAPFDHRGQWHDRL
jgi:pyruvate/2-oxoglutarate dehydrogenase complex dihydrolipoamide dehydrogenase (E3) component